MMPVSLYDFFRIGQKYHALLKVLHGETADDERLWRLLQRHTPQGVDGQTALRQLKKHEFIQLLEGNERYYRLKPHVERLVGKLLKRQHETSARVIRGFLEELEDVGAGLREALDDRNMEAVRLGIRDLENLVIRIREMAEGNLETITTQVEDITEQHEELTARQRFERINRLWTKIVEPLQQLIEVNKPVDRQLDNIEACLVAVRQGFEYRSLIRRRAASARVQLIAMRRELLQRHRELIGEVEPLYRRLRTESRLATGAAAALKEVRHEGAEALGVEQDVSLFGWRPENLMDDVELRSYMAVVADYSPPEKVELVTPPQRTSLPILSRGEVRGALREGAPIDDVLGYVLLHWEEKPLRVLLKAYSWIYRGDFGTVTARRDIPRRAYVHDDRRITARPVELVEVTT